MKYLIPGGESLERLKLLITLTSIRSEDKIGALTAYYSQGHQEDYACMLFDLDVSNFRKACKTIDDVAATVESIKQLDWKGLLK